MHKVFISYHDANDAIYKDDLLTLNEEHNLFIDGSVDTGDIVGTDRPAHAIRGIIRDDYLRDTTVTIVLVGTQTWGRKHVDWEIYSSMFDGVKNKRSGILVIMLPSVDTNHVHAVHDGEKAAVYPNITNWRSIDGAVYNNRYPTMPERIVDNKAHVSVIGWR